MVLKIVKKLKNLIYLHLIIFKYFFENIQKQKFLNSKLRKEFKLKNIFLKFNLILQN